MIKLDNLKDIPIGSKLELTVTDPIEGKLNIGFVSQIEGYIDNNVIRICAPIFEAKVYPIRVNSYIEAYLFYKSSQIYRIVGYIENRLIIDDIALLNLRVTEKICRIQRRQFFRFSCSVSITLYEKQSYEVDVDVDDKEIFGHTIDLSGGGMSVLTDEPLKTDIELKGKIELENSTFIDFNSKVIRCFRKIINDEVKYISSLRYIDIDYKKREQLVGFIFYQQRLLFKKRAEVDNGFEIKEK